MAWQSRAGVTLNARKSWRSRSRNKRRGGRVPSSGDPLWLGKTGTACRMAKWDGKVGRGEWEGVAPRSAEPLWLSKPGAMRRRGRKRKRVIGVCE